MGFRLMMIAGAGAGAELGFDRSTVAIGRSSDCDVVVADPAVSRKHAKIVRASNGYILQDLRSSNGTKLNGARMDTAPLAEGDELAVGSARFRFHLDGAVPSECTSPDQLRSCGQPPVLARAARRRTAFWALVRVNWALVRAKSRLAASALAEKWAFSSKRRRALILAAMPLTAVAVLAAGSRLPKRAPPVVAEPTSLTGSLMEKSFGLGPGVSYPHPDAKGFDYAFDAPGRAAVLLHFQSRDISEGEVVVTANGVTVASVPPDLLDVEQVFHQVVIPPGLLKKGERNRIAFESTRNPPHRDTWRVWNLWVETKALPDLSPAELMREASAVFARAEQNFARREIAAANRYAAWKDFRSAWLMLEALPDPKPDLYLRAQERVAKAQRELDRVCASLLLHLQRSLALGDTASAREALQEVKSYFPGTDQPCPWKAEQRRSELNL